MLSGTVGTAKLVAEKFEQGKALESKLAELGGFEVARTDPQKRAQVVAMLDASDQVLLGALETVGEEVLKSRREVEELLNSKFTEQSIGADLRHEGVCS